MVLISSEHKELPLDLRCMRVELQIWLTWRLSMLISSAEKGLSEENISSASRVPCVDKCRIEIKNQNLKTQNKLDKAVLSRLARFKCFKWDSRWDADRITLLGYQLVQVNTN